MVGAGECWAPALDTLSQARPALDNSGGAGKRDRKRGVRDLEAGAMRGKGKLALDIKVKVPSGTNTKDVCDASLNITLSLKTDSVGQNNATWQNATVKREGRGTQRW